MWSIILRNRARCLELFLLALCCTALVVSCTSSSDNVPTVEQLVDLDGTRELSITLHSGRVVLQPAEDAFLLLKNAADEPLQVIRDGNTMRLKRESARQDSEVVLSIPQDLAVEIHTDRADVQLTEMQNPGLVDSVSGNIRLENCSGEIRIRAQRGDVSIERGSGTLTVIGEHGTLLVDGFSGPVSMTTIMGTLEYAAPQESTADIHLETDHGPVRVTLPENASLDVVVQSTSGEVACMAAELDQTADGCAGMLGTGEGSLYIRTVSGRVQLVLTPVIEEGKDD